MIILISASQIVTAESNGGMWLAAGVIALVVSSIAFSIAWLMCRNNRRYASLIRSQAEAILADEALPQETEKLSKEGVCRDTKKTYTSLLPALSHLTERLRFEVHHDRLTGLLNAEGLRVECEAMLTKAKEGEGALLLCDVNEFLDISDRFGSRSADRLLLSLAERLKMASSSFRYAKLAAFAAGEDTERREPIVARTSNDEFAIFLPAPISKEEAERFVQLTKRLITQPMQMEASSLHAEVSIGVAMTGEHHNIFEQVMAATNTALLSAKRDSEDHICFYHAEMRNKAARILDREVELRNAIREGQFALYYQPQLNLKNGMIEGAEALIRWNHPKRGLVMPGDFMPFAETYGLVGDIGNWVIREATKTASQWHKDGLDLRVSVNVSPKQLAAADLIPNIRACLKHYELPAELFEIEFTESAIMVPDDTLFERLLRLQKEGVSMALDDFGTGYSNLAQLLAAPLNRIKLDRSLLEEEGRVESKRLVILSAIRLARQLGIQVVCEGIETLDQLKFLERAKCQLAQGYFISRPVPEAKFLALVNTHNATSSTFLSALGRKGEGQTDESMAGKTNPALLTPPANAPTSIEALRKNA